MISLVRKCTVLLSKLVPTRQSSLPFQTLLFSSSAEVSVPTAEFLITKQNISPETALKVSSAISHLRNPLRTDSVLSFLRQTGFSLPQIDQMIYKYPRILNLSPENLKKKVKIFQEKGISTPDTIHIIYKNPSILFRSSEKCTVPSFDALKAALGSTDAVCRVLKKLAWFLKNDLSKTMIPNMEFLKKRCELSSSRIADFVMLCPRFFLLRHKTVEDGARRLDEMGLKLTSKNYFYVLLAVCTITEEKLKLNMRLLQGLGLSDHDVLRVFQTCPNVFFYSENKIDKTMEVLLGSGRADPSLPLKLVGLLMYSLEERIKPRLEVVKALEDRGLFPKKLRLSTILKMSNKRFLHRFVLADLNARGDDCKISNTKKLVNESAV